MADCLGRPSCITTGKKDGRGKCLVACSASECPAPHTACGCAIRMTVATSLRRTRWRAAAGSSQQTGRRLSLAVVAHCTLLAAKAASRPQKKDGQRRIYEPSSRGWRVRTEPVSAASS